MIKIGIAPTYTNTENKPFQSSYSFRTTYPKQIIKQGAIPQGILLNDGKITNKELNQYDGFIIPGGDTPASYHLVIIHYAIKNNKPLLGICLGIQALGLYDYISKSLKIKTIKNILEKNRKITETDYLKKVEGHNTQNPFNIKNITKSKHEIQIKQNTKLYEIYKQKTIYQPSIHNYAIKEISDNFIVSAKSNDNIIEAIEYNGDKYIIGVQFHPELEEENQILFKNFIQECLKRS